MLQCSAGGNDSTSTVVVVTVKYVQLAVTELVLLQGIGPAIIVPVLSQGKVGLATVLLNSVTVWCWQQ